MLRRIAFIVVGCLCLVGTCWSAIGSATDARAADQHSALTADWTGVYFNNTTLTGSPALTRDDGTTLAFVWPDAPAPEIGADYFSVRWTMTDDFDGGTYRFALTHDDGGRLLVDGALVMEQWYMQVPTTYGADVDLAPGPHMLTVEYYTTWGGAVAGLQITRLSSSPLPPTLTPTATNSAGAPPSTPTIAPTPTATLAPTLTATETATTAPTLTATFTPTTAPTLAPTATPTLAPAASATPTRTPTPVETPTPSAVPSEAVPDAGSGSLQFSELVGDYFNNTTLAAPDVMKRDDGTQLNFRWPDSPAPGVAADYFSVRWGQLLTTDGGTFRFTFTHDDGARLFIDDTLIQDDWYMQVPTTFVSDVTLAPGQHLLEVEYYHTWAGAVVVMDVRSLSAPTGPVVLPATPTVTPSVTAVAASPTGR